MSNWDTDSGEQTALRDHVDTADVGMHWVNADGRILWANAADHEVLGYTADEYVGHDIREFHADPNVIADVLRRLAEGERLSSFPVRLRCKDATVRNVLLTSSAKFDDAGRFVHTRCFTIADTTPRPDTTQLQIEALSRELERLRAASTRERGLVEAILTNSPHGIIIADASGALILQNTAAEEIWRGSASAHDVAGWDQYRAFHPDGRPFEGSDWSMARALATGKSVAAEEIHFQRFDDSHGVLLGSTAPIFSDDGILEGALSVFSDITEFKQQERELRIAAKRYHTTLESIGDAVIATDARGIVDYLNPVAATLTGWSLAAAIGRPLSDIVRLIDEQTRTPVRATVDDMLARSADPAARPVLLIARDGTEIAVEDRGAPIRVPDARLDGFVAVFRDVGAQRRDAERRTFIAEAGALLGSSLDYAQTLARVAQLAVPTLADWCVVDVVDTCGTLRRLAITHVDPAKVRLAQELKERYPPNPNSPHGVHHVLRTGQAAMLPSIPESLIAQAAVDDDHLRILRTLGLRSSMVVPLTCRGRTFGALSFVSAESGRNFGEASLAFAKELARIAAFAVDNARLYQEAQDANRAKDEFLAVVSHELRTPLSAVLGWAQLLRKADIPQSKRDHALATIERNARMQVQLIEDLLDVSRIIAGNLRIDIERVDLAKVIAAAVDSAMPVAHAKSVTLEVRFKDGDHAVDGDIGRLQQILANLLTNAIKFSEEHGVVTVSLTRTNQHAVIRVSDTGAGIDPADLPHIFTRFNQSTATIARSKGGLGLGLAIVRHLVELHGGSVTAHSDGLNTGATFAVQLPLAE